MITVDLSAPIVVLNIGSDENRINPEWLEGINDALDQIQATPPPKALLTVADGKFFSNGLDLDWMSANPTKSEAFLDDVETVLARMVGLGAPTVAAIQGHVFAAGAMSAVAHDYRLMRDDRGFFCLPEVDIKMAFRPGMSRLLTAKLPVSTARDAMTTGRRYGGHDAAGAGIVDSATDADSLRHETTQLAISLADKAGDTLGTIKSRMYADAITALTSRASHGPAT